MSRLSCTAVTCALSLLASGGLAGPKAMTAEEARHLISRTGFGAAPHEISALTGKSYREGVDLILGGLSAVPHTSMPGWVNATDYPADHIWLLGQTAEELFFSNRWMEIEELSGWWISEMVATPTPMTERLTLFWHDHFATSYQVVENPQWMARQNQFLRQHAAGNFADLAHGILRDPAMLVYLTNTENNAEDPNENLGREFLELFTLGEGRGYTQADVVSAARMLTGHSIAELTAPVYTFYPTRHDHRPKTIFGQTGPFDAGDLVTLTLSHPDFGPFIVEKLWRQFVSDQPDPAEVERLTRIWRDNDLEIVPLLEAMLLSDAFWAAENRGRLIKAPVDLVVGSLRSLGLPMENATALAWTTYDMGQALFFPPNVGGWPEGVGWINDATVTARATALSHLAFGWEEEMPTRPAMMQMPAGHGAAVAVGPDDLRVGQVFAMELSAQDDGLGGLFVLHDVSFGGETWHALPVWVEANTAEDYAGYGILTTGCHPGCFDRIEGQEDGWIWYGPWENVLRDDLPDATGADVALLQAIAGHLPALIATTEGQVSWQPDPFATGADDDVPALADMIDMAQDLKAESVRAIGPTQSQLVTALRAPGVLGLQGADAVADVADIDDYLQTAEQARIRPVIPAVTYSDAGKWLAALPPGGLDSQRAAAALLAVPRQGKGQRDEMIAADPAALLRALILAPEFQVN